MKFIVSSSVLLRNLQEINGFLSKSPIVETLENFLFGIENGHVVIQADEIKPIKLNSTVTAIIILKEVNKMGFLDDVDELILEIYNDNRKISSIHHYDFERVVRKLFSGLGYEVTPTKRTRDGGYDMVAIQEGLIPTRHLIECKTRKKSPLGIEVIERFLFKINELKASTGVVITNLRFSADVLKKYANEVYKHYLRLIDRDELIKMIRNYIQSLQGLYLTT